LGAEEVIVGLEKAVQEMKKGEKASFAIQPKYAYGSVGKPELNIAAEDTLTYEIELLECETEKSSYDLSFPDKCQFVTKKREEGNEYFKQGKL